MKYTSTKFQVPSTDDEEIKNKILLSLQERFLTEGALVIHEYKHNDSLSLNEFYLKLFKLTEYHITYSEYKLPDNYKHEDYTPNGRRRSLTDLYRICYNYYRCSFADFLKVVVENEPVEYYCPDICNSIVAPVNLRPSWADYEGEERLWNKVIPQFGYRTFWQLIELID